MWLKADSLTKLADQQPVELWSDSSSNSLHCRQAAAKQRPRWIRHAIAQQPALRFDGEDDSLLFDHYPGLFHSFYDSSIFVVIKPTTGGTILSQAHTNLSTSGKEAKRLVYSSSLTRDDGTVAWPQLQSKATADLAASRSAVCAIIRRGNGEEMPCFASMETTTTTELLFPITAQARSRRTLVVAIGSGIIGAAISRRSWSMVEPYRSKSATRLKST